MIPYGRQTIDDHDRAAMAAVLASDWLTQGPTITQFEQQLAAAVQADHAVVMANGTAALHAACAALGLGPHDYLWTSPISFVASANCARYLGAQVDFVDIDPHTRNICVLALRTKLEQAKTQRCLPKILVAVHFAGKPCDMQVLGALSREFGFAIIEDAAHALGSFYGGRPVGSCQYSVATCFSFHPVKNITTGEGGAVTTRDAMLADKIRKFCSHGITKNPADFVAEAAEPWAYEQHALGYNYRLTDIQAALGISQLQKLPGFVARRQALVDVYQSALADMPLFLPPAKGGDTIAWHIYTIQLHDTQRRLAMFNELRAAGIGVNVHYIPIHLQPYYQRRGFHVGDFPGAEAYYAGAITLPLFPTLTDDEQNFIVHTLRGILCA